MSIFGELFYINVYGDKFVFLKILFYVSFSVHKFWIIITTSIVHYYFLNIILWFLNILSYNYTYLKKICNNNNVLKCWFSTLSYDDISMRRNRHYFCLTKVYRSIHLWKPNWTYKDDIIIGFLLYLKLEIPTPIIFNGFNFTFDLLFKKVQFTMILKEKGLKINVYLLLWKYVFHIVAYYTYG